MKNFVTMTKDEQRAVYSRNVMAAATLELTLRQLVRETLHEGNLQSAAHFQQLIQYAPDETKTRIDDYITVTGKRP